ncbi:MAG: ABC transporter ATP-binding protein [Deltaproteobacteria bacterium]
MIRFEQVTKRYITGTSTQIVPVNRVDLEVQSGERIILFGKSGSGKTTFLNLVGGVDLPTEGRIFFDGQDLSALSAEALAHYRRREVGFIFQSFNLFSTLTVGENVMLPLDLLGISDESRARTVLAAVGLDGEWDRFPEKLSGGEQQRVAIARALVKEPRVILADEPTGNLDLETGNQILEIINDVSRSANAALIMATHSPEALWLADRTLRIKGGSLVEESMPRRESFRQQGGSEHAL